MSARAPPRNRELWIVRNNTNLEWIGPRWQTLSEVDRIWVATELMKLGQIGLALLNCISTRRWSRD